MKTKKEEKNVFISSCHAMHGDGEEKKENNKREIIAQALTNNKRKNLQYVEVAER